jgi:VWFA-related protein
MTHAPLVVASALLVALAGGAARQNPPPAFAPVPTLEIDLLATDSKGRPVDDLRPTELEVWIERHRIPIESLTIVTAADERSRRSVVLLLDDITVSPVGVARTKDVAKRFVDRLGPGDQMAIVTLDGGVTKSSDDRAALLRSINSYNVRGGMPLRPDDLSVHVLNTLAAVSRQFSESSARRRTIVAIGSGWVFDTPIPPPNVARDVRKEWTEAVRSMARENVTLYVIDPGGVGRSRVASPTSGFARETGGLAFTNTNDMDGAVTRILREAVGQYIVTIANPPVFQTAEIRALDVRSLRNGVTVRAARFLPGASR